MLNKYLKLILVTLSIIVGALIALGPTLTSAAPDPCAGLSGAQLQGCRKDNNLSPTGSSAGTCQDQGLCSDNGQVSGNTGCTDSNNPGQCTIFSKYLIPIINFLSALVGLIVTIMIVLGAIQYSAAGGDPQRVAAAKSRIFNAILALLAFAFLWAFLQWIVPGGIFK